MTRPPVLRIHEDEVIIDNFAGGGGASTGIEWALGRSPDVAVNHSAEAIAMHEANHPNTLHIVGDVWDVNPKGVCGGRRVALAWFSPDCRHHSKAKGGKPRERKDASKSRALAWVVTRWAREVKPRVIMLENVEEFSSWGPLDNDGRPNKAKMGLTFRRWLGELKAAGYQVEMRELRAHDFGAPTIRKRLFIIARSDGQPIVWPEPTHGPGRRAPHRAAAECIDWSLPCPSIFERSKPLAPATLRRIARGIARFVVNAATPFVVLVGPSETAVLGAPTLIQTGYGERPGQAPRSLDLHAPLGTVVGGGAKHAIVVAFLAKHNGGHEATGSDLREPIHTITTQDHHSLVTAHLLKVGASVAHSHANDVRALLSKYFVPEAEPQQLSFTARPTKRERLIYVDGEAYAIVDIGMRMLAPHELFRAQGFKHSQTDLEFTAWPDQTIHEVDVRRSPAKSVRAKYAAPDSSPGLEPGSNGVAVVHARIDCERKVLEILSRDASRSRASAAEILGSYPLAIEAVASARSLVRTAPTSVRTTRPGRVEIAPNSSRSTFPDPGERHAVWFGGETSRRAGDARKSTSTPAESDAFTSITSADGLSFQTSDSISQTLFSFVARVIASFIRGRMSRASSFEVHLELKDFYVIDPIFNGKPMTKTAQIKCCGNSVCPPMAAALVRSNFQQTQVVAA